MQRIQHSLAWSAHGYLIAVMGQDGSHGKKLDERRHDGFTSDVKDWTFFARVTAVFARPLAKVAG
jgi:hypothetical protein